MQLRSRYLTNFSLLLRPLYKNCPWCHQQVGKHHFLGLEVGRKYFHPWANGSFSSNQVFTVVSMTRRFPHNLLILFCLLVLVQLKLHDIRDGNPYSYPIQVLAAIVSWITPDQPDDNDDGLTPLKFGLLAHLSRKQDGCLWACLGSLVWWSMLYLNGFCVNLAQGPLKCNIDSDHHTTQICCIISNLLLPVVLGFTQFLTISRNRFWDALWIWESTMTQILDRAMLNCRRQSENC